MKVICGRFLCDFRLRLVLSGRLFRGFSLLIGNSAIEALVVRELVLSLREFAIRTVVYEVEV